MRIEPCLAQASWYSTGALILVAVWLGCSRDSTPPGSPAELSITTSYEDNAPAFTWTAAEDQGSGVAYYLARMDGVSRMKLGNVTACNWGSALSDGSHSLELKAVDKHGNEGLSATQVFLVDKTPPPKTWPISPGNWDCTDDTTPSFEWGEVSDASGVTYRLQIDDNDDFSSPIVNVHGVAEPEYTLTQSGPGRWRLLLEGVCRGWGSTPE